MRRKKERWVNEKKVSVETECGKEVVRKERRNGWN